jgi:hypothetical protein
LAQLILGEERIRFTLRLVEGSALFPFQSIDAGEQSSR